MKTENESPDLAMFNAAVSLEQKVVAHRAILCESIIAYLIAKPEKTLTLYPDEGTIKDLLKEHKFERPAISIIIEPDDVRRNELDVIRYTSPCHISFVTLSGYSAEVAEISTEDLIGVAKGIVEYENIINGREEHADSHSPEYTRNLKYMFELLYFNTEGHKHIRQSILDKHEAEFRALPQCPATESVVNGIIGLYRWIKDNPTSKAQFVQDALHDITDTVTDYKEGWFAPRTESFAAYATEAMKSKATRLQELYQKACSNNELDDWNLYNDTVDKVLNDLTDWELLKLHAFSQDKSVCDNNNFRKDIDQEIRKVTAIPEITETKNVILSVGLLLKVPKGVEVNDYARRKIRYSISSYHGQDDHEVKETGWYNIQEGLTK